MKVSRERLSVIGRMIGIYREERRGNTQNNWTQIKFCDEICSPNTLKNIENGGIARSQELYVKLLEKFDLKLGEFPVIDEAVEELIDKLYTAIEYFDNTEIDSLTLKGIRILSNAKDYAYYNELYSIFDDVRSYYLNIILIEDEKCIRYMSEIDLFGHKITNIIKVLSFANYKNKCVGDLDYYKSIVENLKMENSDYPCLKINLMHYYYLTDQRFKMMSLARELETYFVDEGNWIRLVDIYNSSIAMLSELDKNECLNYMNKVEHILKNYKIPVEKKSEVHANIATYYYNHKNFNAALEHLNISISEGSRDILSSSLIIADCQNRLDLKINIPKLSKKYQAKYPKDLRTVYNYFLLCKDDVPAVFRQKMIIKSIASLLKDKILIEIFRFELNKLVKETNSYKDLHIFNEITNNYLK